MENRSQAAAPGLCGRAPAATHSLRHREFLQLHCRFFGSHRAGCFEGEPPPKMSIGARRTSVAARQPAPCGAAVPPRLPARAQNRRVESTTVRPKQPRTRTPPPPHPPLSTFPPALPPSNNPLSLSSGGVEGGRVEAVLWRPSAAEGRPAAVGFVGFAKFNRQHSSFVAFDSATSRLELPPDCRTTTLDRDAPRHSLRTHVTRMVRNVLPEVAP